MFHDDPDDAFIDNSENTMTREEVQKEYDKLAPTLGVFTYKYMVPVLEFLGMCQRMYFLNQEMGQIKEKEAAECQSQKPVAVPDLDTK